MENDYKNQFEKLEDLNKKFIDFPKINDKDYKEKILKQIHPQNYKLENGYWNITKILNMNIEYFDIFYEELFSKYPYGREFIRDLTMDSFYIEPYELIGDLFYQTVLLEKEEINKKRLIKNAIISLCINIFHEKIKVLYYIFHKKELKKEDFYSYLINNLIYLFNISSTVTLISSIKERKKFIRKLYYIYEQQLNIPLMETINTNLKIIK